MTIFRRRHTANFTTISNVLFDDDRLAADEVGILAYLLSRPKDWEVRRPALQRRWAIGREAMKRIMFNWIRTGWCWPVRDRAPNGTTFVIYEIRDAPGPSLSEEEVRKALSLGSGDASADEFRTREEAEGDLPETNSPPTGYPSLADPSPDNPSLANYNIPNKDLPKDESNQNLEREALRSREKHALNLAQFKRRWPTIASDDQTKVDNAWFALSETEGEEALAGITPFLEHQKRLHKKHPPAGFNYLGQKRWTLLDQAAQAPTGSMVGYERDSAEFKAIKGAYEIAGTVDALSKINVREGRCYYGRPITPRLLALGELPEKDAWVVLTRQQAAAWDSLLRDLVTVQSRRPFREGDRAPHPWPPKVDGTWSPTGAPDTLMSEQDFRDFKA